MKGKLLTFGFALVMIASFAACDMSMADMTNDIAEANTPDRLTALQDNEDIVQPWNQREFGYDNERGEYKTQQDKQAIGDKNLKRDVLDASEKAKNGLEDIGDDMRNMFDNAEQALS